MKVKAGYDSHETWLAGDGEKLYYYDILTDSGETITGASGFSSLAEAETAGHEHMQQLIECETA